MDAQEYCRDVIRQAGHGAALEVAMSPARHRPAVSALCALRLTLAKIPQIEDPGVAHTKLQWWEGELLQLCTGQARHPISQALTEHRLGHVHEAPIHTLCAGVRRIIDRETDVSTLDHWLSEAQSVGGAQAEMETHYLSGHFDSVMTRSLGGIAEAARWCRATAHPWLSAPADLRARFQVSNTMLRSTQPHPEVGSLRAQVLKELTGRSQDLLRSAVSGGRGLPPSLVIAARLSLTNLAAHAAGVRPNPSPFKWLFQAWRGARQAARTPWQGHT